MIQKIFKMALTIFLVVFVFALLVSGNNAGQVSSPNLNFKKDTPALILPYLQESLLDSIRRLDIKKEELVSTNDSSMQVRSKKRVKVMQGIRELIHKKPKIIIIRDTIRVPVYIDSIDYNSFNFSYLN